MAGGIGGLPSSGPRGRPSPVGIVRPRPAAASSAVVAMDRDRVRMPRPGARPGASASCRSPSGRASGSPCAARGGLTAAELIGLLWGSGTRGRSAVDLATDALARHDGLTGLARATRARSSRRCPGSARRRPRSWSAAFELGRRLLADWPAGALDDPRRRATSPTG